MSIPYGSGGRASRLAPDLHEAAVVRELFSVWLAKSDAESVARLASLKEPARRCACRKTTSASAKRPKRLPVVLIRAEVSTVLRQLVGTHGLMGGLLYGGGLRLSEYVKLRVKDFGLGWLSARRPARRAFEGQSFRFDLESGPTNTQSFRFGLETEPTNTRSFRLELETEPTGGFTETSEAPKPVFEQVVDFRRAHLLSVLRLSVPR